MKRKLAGAVLFATVAGGGAMLATPTKAAARPECNQMTCGGGAGGCTYSALYVCTIWYDGGLNPHCLTEKCFKT